MTDAATPYDPNEPTHVSPGRRAKTAGEPKAAKPDDVTAPLEYAPHQAISVPDDAGEKFVGTNMYTRGEEIGRGGMGRISAAFDHNLQRQVAIKEVLDVHQSPEMNERFLREAYLTGELEHPGTVPVYSFGVHEDGRMFYAMRRIGGRTLRDAIRDLPNTLPLWEQAGRQALLQRFLQACQAIAYAHDRGIIHRDIKPSNIMLGEFGETIVLDWGAAKRIGEAEPPQVAPGARATLSPTDSNPSGGRYRSPHTHAGAIIGTPAYMAPEQARGATEEVGPAADVFSLGATLYEIVTGVAPYHESGEQALDAAVAAQYRRPRRLCPGLPRDLETIILKAMAPKPGDRYPNAGAMAHELEQYLTGARVSSHQYSPYALLRRWLRQRRTFLAVSMLVTVLVGAIGLGVATVILASSLAAVIVWGVDAQLRGATSLVEEWLAPADGALTLAEQIAQRYGNDTVEAEAALASAVGSFPNVAMMYYAHGRVGELPVTAGSDYTRAFPPGIDARTRPWYQGALAAKGALAVSGPYPDVNTGEPTISVSRIVPGLVGDQETVVAVDLRLNTLAQPLLPGNFPDGGAVLIAATSEGTPVARWKNALPILVSSTLPANMFDPSEERAPAGLVRALNEGTLRRQALDLHMVLRDLPQDASLENFTVEHLMLVNLKGHWCFVFSTSLDIAPWTVSLFIPVITGLRPFVEGVQTFVTVTSAGLLCAAIGLTAFALWRYRYQPRKRARDAAGMSLPPQTPTGRLR